MKNNTILKALTGILFVSVLTVGAFALAPAAHAQEFDGGYDFGSDIGTGCCGDVSYPDSIDYNTPADQVSYPDSVDYTQPSYDTTGYDTSSYDTGYSTGGYSTGGYSTGGYSYTTPYYAPAPVYTTPSYTAPSNVYAPTTITTNTCTGSNNCNTDDHSVVNITNPAPVINNNNVVANYAGGSTGYVAPVQYCASGYYGTYPNCYLNYQQPVVYQRAPIAYNASTPYVSLTQVPYTGLDLGFWGTIAYWGAMVLFALVVAYFIAIKRVQNTIARKLKSFLFGSDVEYAEESAVAAHVTPAQARSVEFVAAAQSSEDVIDSFIMSQINRPRRA